MTDVAWFTLAQPTAGAASDDAEADAEADDVTGADEVAEVPAGFEAVAEAQPATAEHSSTASTVPRTGRGDIMLLGRTPHLISSIPSRQSTPAAMTMPTTISSAHAISSLCSPAAAPIRAPSSRPTRDMATLTTPNTAAATARLV